MDHLKDLDPVAYVRFASVYREFKDIDTFMDEIKSHFSHLTKRDETHFASFTRYRNSRQGLVPAQTFSRC